MAKSKRKFETERTRQFRAQELDAHEKSTINHIEETGCSVLHISSPDKDADRPLFSYTVGAFDTSGGPEIICVGLKEGLGQFLLNEAVKRQRAGVDLSVGRHSDLLGDVECEFRPVAKKWIEHVMGWAVWYNGDSDFPALQAVYPDRENRFPGDEGFNKYFSQPMLQADTPETTKEQDFWASNDPDSSLFDWKFPDDPHTGVYLSKTVHEGTEDVTYISHDLEDGAWQFLGDTMSDPGGVLSCFHHPIDKDPTLKELADLPIGWYAEREKPGQPWIRYPLPPSESEPEDVTE